MFVQEERTMPRRSTRSRSRGRAEPVASPKTPKTPKSTKKVRMVLYLFLYSRASKHIYIFSDIANNN